MFYDIGNKNFHSLGQSNGKVIADTIKDTMFCLIRQIKELLYDNGYTILGAKQKLNADENSKQTKASAFKEIEQEVQELIDILE